MHIRALNLILFFSLFLIILTSNAAKVNNLNIVISEVMANPAAVSDSAGEWFEIFNAGSSIIDLNGYQLRDLGSNAHTISSTSALNLSPGEYFVLGRNADPLLNGGYIPDYVYSNFSLGNNSDEIIINDGIRDIVSLSYSNNSVFGVNGNSAEILSDLSYGLSPVNFTYGLGDIGSPGEAGSYQVSPAAVPEPTSILLFLVGLVLLFSFRKKYLASTR